MFSCYQLPRTRTRLLQLEQRKGLRFPLHIPVDLKAPGESCGFEVSVMASRNYLCSSCCIVVDPLARLDHLCLQRSNPPFAPTCPPSSRQRMERHRRGYPLLLKDPTIHPRVKQTLHLLGIWVPCLDQSNYSTTYFTNRLWWDRVCKILAPLGLN